MLDVAVVGMPDDRAGELPRAYVVCRPDSAVAPPDILKYVEGKFTEEEIRCIFDNI